MMATVTFRALLPAGLGSLNLDLYQTDGAPIASDQSANEGSIPGRYEWVVTVATVPAKAIAQVGYPDGTLVLSERVSLAAGDIVRLGDAASQAGVDTLESAIDAIRTKTALIGTGLGLIHSPVTATGEIREIVAGDDYTSDINRAFAWSLPASKFGDLTGSEMLFLAEGQGCICGSKMGPLQGEIADVATETQRAILELSSAQSTASRGEYRWEIQITTAAGKKFTPLRGETRVVRGLMA